MQVSRPVRLIKIKAVSVHKGLVFLYFGSFHLRMTRRLEAATEGYMFTAMAQSTAKLWIAL